MLYIDRYILLFFAAHRLEWLNFLALAITYAGSYFIVIGLTVLSSVSFCIHKHSIRALSIFITVGGSAVTTYILKALIARPRPPAAFMMYVDTGPSFPSGHATAAMALYGFLIYAVWKSDRHYLKYALIAMFSALILLVGASRLYLGMHYLTDVLAGYAVGLIWIFIGAWVERKIQSLLNWSPKIPK